MRESQYNSWLEFLVIWSKITKGHMVSPQEDNDRIFILYYTKDFIEIYRHQQPFVTDMVIDILRKENIPCYMQQGSIAGILLAAVFPVAAPGVEYVVFVPKILYKKSKEILDNLPVDRELLNVKWLKSSDPKRQLRLIIFWLLILGHWVYALALTVVQQF